MPHPNDPYIFMMKQVGGKLISEGPDSGGWNFGIRLEKNMSEDELTVINELKKDCIFPLKYKADYTFKAQTDAWKCSKGVNNGEFFPTLWQKTGSCVGNGAWNCATYDIAMELVIKKDIGRFEFPTWLVAYGMSRFFLGDRGPGEGSTGSTMFKAAKEVGFLYGTYEGLPKYTIQNGNFSYTAAEEMKFSDGYRMNKTLLDASKAYTFAGGAQVTTRSQAVDLLQKGYFLTIASNWGGRMRPTVQGTPPVLLNDHVDNWNHQMSVIAYWDHPQFSDIFYVLNSWGRDTHGICPSGMPPGGFWIRGNDMDYIIRQGETYTFQDFHEYETRTLPTDFYW